MDALFELSQVENAYARRQSEITYCYGQFTTTNPVRLNLLASIAGRKKGPAEAFDGLNWALGQILVVKGSGVFCGVCDAHEERGVCWFTVDPEIIHVRVVQESKAFEADELGNNGVLNSGQSR